jgi:hypothetical protein
MGNDVVRDGIPYYDSVLIVDDDSEGGDSASDED